MFDTPHLNDQYPDFNRFPYKCITFCNVSFCVKTEKLMIMYNKNENMVIFISDPVSSHYFILRTAT